MTAPAGCRYQTADADVASIDAGLTPTLEISMSKLTDTHTTISEGTKEQLDAAEARHREQLSIPLFSASPRSANRQRWECVCNPGCLLPSHAPSQAVEATDRRVHEGSNCRPL